MRKKILWFLPYAALGFCLLLLLFLNLFCQDHWLDSDMAAEMIFSRLLSEEGRLFATPDWYYSTEFRILYTQLIMGPLFRLTGDWQLIRTITNLVFYGLMLAAYFYFMKPLKVSRPLTVLSACLLLLPFSETMMTHMQIGNTYLSHVILILFFFGMFLRLAGREKNGWRRVLLLLLYLGLAIVCGMSGVRYLLALQFPLALTALLFLTGAEEFQALRRQLSAEQLHRLCRSREMTILLYSLLGAVGSLTGYVVNVLWVSRQYVFQTYGATNFIALYQGVLFERLQNALGCLLMLFGYIPDKGFLSLRGVISLAAFLLPGLLAYSAMKSKKRETRAGFRQFTTLFLLVSFCVNVFVFVFTTSTMVPRYYITIFIFALPVLCFYLEKEPFPLDRMLVALLFAGCILLGTVKTVFSFVSVDKNAQKRPVAQFLAENDYSFGFATYTNGNIITELTEGAVEIANIGDPAHLEYFKWSSPVRYYEENYCTGETFLLLTAQEYAEFADTAAVRAGEEIYRDDSYIVLLYDSVSDLMKCAE